MNASVMLGGPGGTGGPGQPTPGHASTTKMPVGLPLIVLPVSVAFTSAWELKSPCAAITPKPLFVIELFVTLAVPSSR